MIRGVWQALRRRHRADAEARMAHVPARAETPRGVAAPEQALRDVETLLARNALEQAAAQSRALVAAYPTCARSLCLAGQVMLVHRQPQEALALFERALEQRPDALPALLGQGRAYVALERTEDAADSFEIAAAIDGGNAAARLELARLYHDAGADERAIGYVQAVLEREPACAEAWYRLASIRAAQGDAAAAQQAYERALGVDPHYVAARIGLGLLWLQERADPAAAEQEFRIASEQAPGEPAALANLGLALQEQGRFDEAYACYETGIARFPATAEFRWNRGMARLLCGDYATGWVDYEARFERDRGRAARKFPFPRWSGEFPPPGALLIYAEQGLGDEVMFASCIPDLIERGASVVLECSPRLVPLFRRSFTGVRVHGAPRDGRREWLEGFPEIAAQVPIGSLPLHLRRSLEAFARHDGYLRADPVRVDFWRERFARLGPGSKVGLAWRSGTVNTRKHQRSLPLAELASLAQLTEHRFVCLQHDANEQELACFPQLAVFPELHADIDELAAALAALDLAVCVGGGTVGHLAGALGTPVWILLNRSPEWRWRWTGSDTPWYPSARLFRQSEAGCWGTVISEVIEVLARTPGILPSASATTMERSA